MTLKGYASAAAWYESMLPEDSIQARDRNLDPCDACGDVRDRHGNALDLVFDPGDENQRICESCRDRTWRTCDGCAKLVRVSEIEDEQCPKCREVTA